MSDEATGYGSARVSLDPKDDEVVKMAKGLVEKSKRTADLRWIGKLASMTSNVQNHLEEAIQGAINDDKPALNKAGFLAWGRATRGKKDEHGTELVRMPLVNMLYLAFAACVAWEEGIDWAEEDSCSLEDQCNRLYDRGTDKAMEQADVLDEAKAELDGYRNEMEGLLQEGQQPMLWALLDGNLDEVVDALQTGCFELDIGVDA